MFNFFKRQDELSKLLAQLSDQMVESHQTLITVWRQTEDELRAEIAKNTVNDDMVNTAVKLMDELSWKWFALLRILLVGGVMNPRDVAGVLSIEDEPTFRTWVAQHNDSMPADARKFFNDIMQSKDLHKDPG